MINRRRNYTLHFLYMAVLAAIAIGLLNYLAMEHRVRIDLTADQRYTLSEGTQRLLDNLTETVTLTYYVSDEPPAKRINLERDVRDKLEEIASLSRGKLQYRVEHITNAEMASRQEALAEKGIFTARDFMLSGTDAAASIRGAQDYYSSLEIRSGAAEPRVINAIVNLVEPLDESMPNRVDTLEFDIAYTLLTMREDTRKPPFRRLLQARSKPIRVAYFKTDPMPEQHREMATAIDAALDEITQLAPGKLLLERVNLPPGSRSSQPYPYGGGSVNLEPFDGRTDIEVDDQGRATPKFTLYFAALVVQLDPDENAFVPIWDFSEHKTAEAVRSLIEDRIWEAARPRTRLGFVLPPPDPEFSDPRQPAEPGQPPQNGHTPLLNFVRQQLDYESVWVDIEGQGRIPRDLACLIVLEANQLGERELYEIERYLAEGGNVVMLVQGWSTRLNLSSPMATSVPLIKESSLPHFEEWCEYMGLEFGQDLLLRRNSKLQPFVSVRDPRSGQMLRRDLAPGPLRMAPVIESGDMDAGNVFTRGLESLPMPLIVQTELDRERLAEHGLEVVELIRMREDVYRYLPSNPSFPELPLSLNLNSAAEVESNPSADPAEGILAQRLEDGALVAAIVSGQFPSYWADKSLKVPGWDGDPEEADAPAVLNGSPGNLLVVSTAAPLNVKYLAGYDQTEIQQTVIPRGITFYRNVAEAFIYGEDLVNLRARTGVAPRIRGPVSNQARVTWYVLCIAAVPLLLMIVAAGRGFVRTRERERYDASFRGESE